MANDFVTSNTMTSIYTNNKAKELVFVKNWKHFCLQEVQVLQNSNRLLKIRDMQK